MFIYFNVCVYKYDDDIKGSSAYGGCLIENREFSMNMILLKYLLLIVLFVRFTLKVHLNVL
jgi:hypothetical protein